jgi:hypothetical protein
MHCMLRPRSDLAVCGLLLSIAIAGCGGGGGALPATPPVISTEPQQGPETPLAASDFDDSIGVNLHMTYVTSPYNTDFDKWSPILITSGIKHIRDAICPYALAWCQGVESVRIDRLADAGIQTDFLTSMSRPFSLVQSYVATMGVAPAAEAFEGPNECDVNPDCGAWQSTETAWQQQLYTLAAPGVTIVGPSMTSQQGYASLGNLSAYLDAGNIHDYVGTDPPESPIGATNHLAWAAATSGGKPVWCTEFNYSTDPTYANNGVPQVVQERYLPRLLFEHLRLGIRRTYIYQLFDFDTDGGAYMGLLNADYTPKPAWTRLLQLLQTFHDDGTSPRTPLTYALDGDTTRSLDHVLFQRSDGTYLLVVWLAQRVYDAGTHSVLTPSTETVRITLPVTVSTATLLHFGDYGKVDSSVQPGANGVFNVPIGPSISILEFRP